MSAGLALALAAVAAAADPRPELVELRFTGRAEEALARVEAAQAADPGAARHWGLDYLRAHLLELLGRPQPAAEAFAQAMGATPALEPYGRYRLARNVERRGHPEVAAGLIASVVADPPRHLAGDAAELFQRTLAAGGDCRLLRGIAPSRLADAGRRLIELAAGDCALRDGDGERARTILLRLLAEGLEDDAARLAAERLDRLTRRGGGPPAEEAGILIGRGLFQHRSFDRALAYLEPAVEGFPAALTDGRFDVAYTAARARFWREEFPAAAAGFGALAGRTTSPHLRAQALFQRGRALELSADWRGADDAFRRAYAADPLGGWAPPALFAALRVEWRRGDEAHAEHHLDLLLGQRRWTDTAARASLFLAASDLVRGRPERAGRWLDLAERGGREAAIEVAYWRGRLAELEAEPEAAVRRYLQALRLDPFHPLAGAARERLAAAGGLAGPAQAEGTRLAASGRSDDLYSAWLLVGDASPWGRAALGRLRKRWEAEGAAGALGRLGAVPPADWPLWRQPLTGPEEMLLALGVWEDGAPAVAEHFPLSAPDLAFTSAALLARSGRTRPSIRIVEILTRRLPSRLPPAAHPPELRRLLYPFAHAEQVVAQALEHGVDPYLLAAVIREESRFDERALSTASARGLTQFVHPTAVRVGRGIGLDRLAPDDLYRPEVAIALGAAYLGELTRRFDGADHLVVAAYNAGEPQARLWRGYCFSSDPAEYFTKVNFSQTRGYLEKVLRSRAHYRDVYGDRRGERAVPPR